MMANNITRLLVPRGLAQLSTRSLTVSTARTATFQLSPAERDKVYPKLGNREIVGYGVNGNPTYADREEFPCPAVRFKEDTSDVVALRQKEKGDWKSLSLEEKKELYRASFCQTYTEMKAPTGEWKSIVAGILLGLTFTGWFMIYTKNFIYPPLPSTMTEEWKEAALDRMIKLRHGHVTGYAAKYDYDNEKWK